MLTTCTNYQVSVGDLFYLGFVQLLSTVNFCELNIAYLSEAVISASSIRRDSTF